MGEAEVKKRIIGKASEQFFKYGFSKVTIDELATQLGMSKKTIYRFFSSKNEILKEAIKKLLEESEFLVNKVVKDRTLEFTERISRLLEFVGRQLSKIETALFDDLQKNAPEIWQEFSEFREKAINRSVRGILEEGIALGVVRNDLNIDLVILLLINSARMILNPEVLTILPVSLKEAHSTIIKVILNGILTKEIKAN